MTTACATQDSSKQTVDSPFIGIHIIVRDSGKTIGALLDSILKPLPAFDEYVIVDTGSVDETRAIIAQAFQVTSTVGERWTALGKTEPISTPWVLHPVVNGKMVRLLLATFDWIDDFSAARNFSFRLGSAKWRGYLDSDDVFPLAHRLGAMIRRTEQRSPESNCIALPYDYSENLLYQDKYRFVRWQDGWTWRDEIHEYLVRDPAGPRKISKYDKLVVQHTFSEENTARSLQRNVRICLGLRDRAIAENDIEKAALMSFYLGQYASALHDDVEAESSLEMASEHLPDNNIACTARLTLALHYLDKGDLERALTWASIAASRTPEFPDGQAVLGIVQCARADFIHASITFDRMRQLPAPPIRSNYDVVLLEGVAPVHAAQAYLAVDRVEEAQAMLFGVPAELRMHGRVREGYMKMFGRCNQSMAFRALRSLWCALVNNDEPVKARRVLENAPVFIADMVGVGDMKRLTDHRLRHLDKGWEEYKALYATLDEKTYETNRNDVEVIRSFTRARVTREWAAGLPQEGAPIRVLSIGPQDCNIEIDVLKANPRIHMTAVDVSVLAEGAIADMVRDFPGRVVHGQIRKDHYDWPDGPFDAIFIFEVLEHVPDDVTALRELRRRLAAGGTLFLSTPVAGFWLNETLSKPKDQTLYDWWGHVRSNSPSTLWQKLRTEGFNGRLDGTESGIVFLARVGVAEPPTSKQASIFVSGTVTPFDPDSPYRGHLGGSEEAVVFLSAALARKGYEVTVYAPKPMRTDMVVHARDGVLWRSLDEFDPETLPAGQPCLFWRSPSLMADDRVRRARCKKLLWLHDANYGVSPETYKLSDKVIVLSKYHAQIIAARDGYTGPFAFAANGIDLTQFPALTQEDDAQRDPYKVVYGSSPDRGLARLLRAWPKIRTREPRATLDIYYSWDLLEYAMRYLPAVREQHKTLRAEAEGMWDLGVTVKGGVDHMELARAYRTAGIWAYPTTFEEISCITAMKAQAAGCRPVVLNSGALAETLNGRVLNPPHPIDSGEGIAWFADEVLRAMDVPQAYDYRKVLSDFARGRFGWDSAADRFIEIFES